MSIAIGILFSLLLAGFVAYSFMRASPVAIAGALRLVGPVLLGVVGLGLVFVGRVALGGMLISAALGWWGRNRFAHKAKRSAGMRSTVRSEKLEMALDHDSGKLEGLVLADRYQGRRLADLTLDNLMDLHEDYAADEESLKLLETYLDGRFASWRERLDADKGAGQGSAARSGGMTKQEAYEVLGLEEGAPPTQIREAYRRLMQRVHPDVGGSSFLSARINEAKDVLLSKHE